MPLKCEDIRRQAEKLARGFAMKVKLGHIMPPLHLHYASTVVLLFIEMKTI